jgi:hypothetical protein
VMRERQLWMCRGWRRAPNWAAWLHRLSGQWFTLCFVR